MNFTEDEILILYHLQKYKFMTIDQTVMALKFNSKNRQRVNRLLREMERTKFIGSFGTTKYGMKNVPNVYYINKSGYEILIDNGFSEHLIGRYKEKNSPGWTPKTSHMLHLIDVLLSLEIGIKAYENLQIIKVFSEYNRVYNGDQIFYETTDYINDDEDEENNKIVPDGAFILQNRQTKECSLFFIEIDMETETILSKIDKNIERSIYGKFRKYDQYLLSGKYSEKYGEWGDFDHFTMLFISITEQHLKNVRAKLSNLPSELSDYYMLNLHKHVLGNFFNSKWQTRDIKDNFKYNILG